MAQIALEDVTKIYSGDVQAVKGLSLNVRDGERMVLLGPSGCGKSTLLRLIAGLESLTGGRILIDGDDIKGVAPEHRDIAMIFQDYALYPHLSVAENIGFSLRMKGVKRKDRGPHVQEVAQFLGLVAELERKPRDLSGGQQQRVAMGRAIIRDPKVFLMDEPLSNLDAQLRLDMRMELVRIQEELGTTTVYVTHDQAEAMALADRIAVMRSGVILQEGEPREVFAKPENTFVATFLGSPRMILLKATVHGKALLLGQQSLEVPETVARSLVGRNSVILGIRPTDMDLASQRDSQSQVLRARIEAVEHLGAETDVAFLIDAEEATQEPHGPGGDSPQQNGEARVPKGKVRCIARLRGDRSVRAGEAVAMRIHLDRAHYFDVASRRRIDIEFKGSVSKSGNVFKHRDGKVRAKED